MNSARSFTEAFHGRDGVSYTEAMMTGQHAMHGRLDRRPLGGNSLGQSRLAMSEVQICGIPKLRTREVDPTP